MEKSGVDVILLRHLPTNENLSGIFMGQSDFSIVPVLNEEPIDLSEIQIRNSLLVYYSPLKRCVQTIDLLTTYLINRYLGRQALDLSLIPTNKLIERGLGAFEGRYKAEIYEAYASELVDKKLKPHYTPPGGETFTDFERRVRSFYQSLLQQAAHLPEKQIVVCSHLQVLRLLTCLHRNLEIEDAWFDLHFKHGVLTAL